MTKWKARGRKPAETFLWIQPSRRAMVWDDVLWEGEERVAGRLKGPGGFVFLTHNAIRNEMLSEIRYLRILRFGGDVDEVCSPSSPESTNAPRA